ncbi:ABC transporter substrate-binding protein [Leptolyngbya sp. AN03gr2]|uniref:ABC transporter substrate-binding protein n=1 Tax=unclassified Leptolyngbya TaxID=2650499 RepID=UPI003D31644E
MDDLFSRLSRRKFILIAGSTALATTVLKGCASDTTAQSGSSTSGATVQPVVDGNNESALYEAAKKEGKLVYYTVFFNQDIVNEIGAAFTKKYPGIQFEGTRKVAGTLFQQLNQEMQSGVKNCDVFGTTDMGQMLQLQSEGKLSQYEPVGKDQMLPEFRNLNPENLYQTGALIPIVIGYNTQKIKADQAPKGWKDLLDPKYKDQVATGSGVASGQVGTWALAMDQKFGWDNYFPQFNQLNPKLGRSINDAVSDVVSGERAIGIVTLGQTLTAKAKGNPVDIVYPNEGSVIVVGPIGILKDAPRPNAARLFMNFLMSQEYAELVAKYNEQPLRADVKVAGAKTIGEMSPIIPTPAQIQAGIPNIRNKWRDKFGA